MKEIKYRSYLNPDSFGYIHQWYFFYDGGIVDVKLHLEIDYISEDSEIYKEAVKKLKEHKLYQNT